MREVQHDTGAFLGTTGVGVQLESIAQQSARRMTDLADVLQDFDAVTEVTDVIYRQGQLDVGVMSYTVGKG